MHLWLQLYGVTEEGRAIIAQIAYLMECNHLRFGFTIMTEIPDPTPNNLLIGQHIMAWPSGLMPSRTPGTHVLAFAFDARTEYAGLSTIMLAAAIAQFGHVKMEMTIQDQHPSRNAAPAHMRGTQVLFWEVLVVATADGTPRIELPAPGGATS